MGRVSDVDWGSVAPRRAVATAGPAAAAVGRRCGRTGPAHLFLTNDGLRYRRSGPFRFVFLSFSTFSFKKKFHVQRTWFTLDANEDQDGNQVVAF